MSQPGSAERLDARPADPAHSEDSTVTGDDGTAVGAAATPEATGSEATATDAAVPGRQPELDLGLVPTGDARVDGALASLDALAELPVEEHAAVFEDVYRQLHAALTTPESSPSGQEPSSTAD